MARNWFKRLFRKGDTPGGDDPPTPRKDLPPCPWIEADQTPWGIRVLDVRPVTHGLLSFSQDPTCASNAISFGSDDGTSFIGVPPESQRSVPATLQYKINRHLADGALSVAAQLDAGVPLDLLAADGLTPLHWALACKDTDTAKFLLERGCPVDVRSVHGATPLMSAVQAKSLDWVNFLLSNGADPNAKDARGFTALHRSAEMGLIDITRTLLAAGAAPNPEAEGHTPLSFAQARGEAQIVNLLTAT